MKETKGITLVSLVITIIILIILAQISINLILGQNGLINKATTAKESIEEVMAREKLEFVLLDLQADKITDSNYNETDYINKRIAENQMTVAGDIIMVDGWQFQIDRSAPKIVTSLGKGEIEINQEITLTVDVKNDVDYTSATLEIAIFYKGEITSIQINGIKIEEIPEKETDGENEKYVLEKVVLQNGSYTILVTDENENYQIKTISVTEISEDMDIYTIADFVKFQERVNKGATYEGRTVRLMNDLNLDTICYEVDGTPENDVSWEPIGNYSEDHKFKGTFNGNHHTIDYLYINNENEYQGLFGLVEYGTITGLVIGNHSNIIGGYTVGGIASKISNSNISNCANNANIIGSGTNIGGIVGYISNTDGENQYGLKYCYNTGNISGYAVVGGICGQRIW